MLAAVDRLRWQKRKYVAFKPKIDDRYGVNRITTHSGGSIDAFEIETGTELLEILNEREGYGIIAVDEAFMIKGVGKTLVDLYRKGNTIIISSLQLSSWGEPFEEMKEMMPWATKIEVCPAVCPITGKDAYYSYSKRTRTDGILVGGDESYEPRCFEHHEYVNESKNK
jgi:thymidine kinase